MEKANLARASKPQRPTLGDYIRGTAKLEDLVDRNKLIKHDQIHTNRRALQASVNSINKTPHRKVEEKYVKHGQPHSASASFSDKSRRRSEKTPTTTTATSNSLRSERSAQGDTTESNASTSTRASVIIDRVLNEKENEIQTLTAEIERLKQASNARREQEMVSMLQKLFEDLPSEGPQLGDSSDFDDVVERLSKAMRAVRESHETFARANAEKEEKLALVSVDNDALRERIESLQSDLQKMTEQNEEYSQQLANIQTQNDRLHADLENTRTRHATGMDMCTDLQTLIKDKFQNETNKMQNYEKSLQDRVEQLDREFTMLESACKQHVQWTVRIPCEQVENLKAELQATEIAKMRQVCEVTALYNEQEKQLNELRRINQQLLEKSNVHETFLTKLRHENRKLESCKQYLQRRNEALQEACQKEIQSMSGPLKEETLAKLNRRSLDAEMAYSKELQKQAEETIRITRGSSDH